MSATFMTAMSPQTAGLAAAAGQGVAGAQSVDAVAGFEALLADMFGDAQQPPTEGLMTAKAPVAVAAERDAGPTDFAAPAADAAPDQLVSDTDASTEGPALLSDATLALLAAVATPAPAPSGQVTFTAPAAESPESPPAATVAQATANRFEPELARGGEAAPAPGQTDADLPAATPAAPTAGGATMARSEPSPATPAAMQPPNPAPVATTPPAGLPVPPALIAAAQPQAAAAPTAEKPADGKSAAKTARTGVTAPPAPTGAAVAATAAPTAARVDAVQGLEAQAAKAGGDVILADAGAQPADADAPQSETPAPLASGGSVSSPVTHAAAAPVRGAPETVANLAAQILKKLDGRSTRFDVELDPLGLGRVDVRVEIGANGRMTTTMTFDNPQAAAELKARAHELRATMEQAGFDLSGGLSFDVAGDQGRAGYRPPQDQGSAPTFRGRAFEAALETAGDAAEIALNSALNQRRAPLSSVDIRI